MRNYVLVFQTVFRLEQAQVQLQMQILIIKMFAETTVAPTFTPLLNHNNNASVYMTSLYTGKDTIATLDLK